MTLYDHLKAVAFHLKSKAGEHAAILEDLDEEKFGALYGHHEVRLETFITALELISDEMVDFADMELEVDRLRTEAEGYLYDSPGDYDALMGHASFLEAAWTFKEER